MTASISDVARELDLGVDVVLAVCAELDIVASGAGSRISADEHRRLRTALGASSLLPPVDVGSHERIPGGGAGPDDRSLLERWDALEAPPRLKPKLDIRRVSRVAIYAFLLIAVGVGVVVLGNRSDDPVQVPAVLALGPEDIGSCVDLPDGLGPQIEVVDCAETHAAEIYEVRVLSEPGSAPYPGQDALAAEADEACRGSFGAYVGATFETSALDVVYLVPRAETWDLADRSIVCLVEDPTGPLVGSVAGTGR